MDDKTTQTSLSEAPTRPLPVVPPPPQPGKGKKPLPLWIKIVVTMLILFLLLGGGAAVYGYFYYENVQQSLTKFIHPVSPGKNEPFQKPIPTNSSVTGRVWNILLLGSDSDNKFNFPVVLTQVMMVIHIDTIHNTVTMVSIPRDSWVYVPGFGMHKIDQAFYLGAQERNNFDDGVRLARLTIEKDYGIPIDRYAWVGLQGFINVINTLGGVDIDVTHPIVDDTYPKDVGSNASNPYDYQRLYLAPGPQHLNGEQALEYVRSRHADLTGDIGRTQRQQQVLEALKQKLSITSLITNLPQLLADLNGYVYTDLSEQEMIGFANFGRNFPTNAIQRITLGPGSGSQDYGDVSTAYDPSAGGDQSVVLPRCENIQPLINRIFGLGNVQSCNVNGP